MNIYTKAFTLLLCSIAAAPLSGMKKMVTVVDDTPADATGLAALITAYSVKQDAAENMSTQLDFDTQVEFAQKIIVYKKDAFVAVGQKQFEIALEALILLNGSLGDERKQLACRLEERLFQKQLWGFGGAAAILGATLFAWRKPVFIPRFLGFLATATGFGIYTIAEQKRYGTLYAKLKSLETLQTSLNTWISTPSPFQTTLDGSGEVPTGNLYPNVDQK